MEVMGFDIREKNGMLSLTDLGRLCRKVLEDDEQTYRSVHDVVNAPNFINSFYYIMNGILNVKVDEQYYFRSVENMGIIPFMKSIGLYIVEGRGEKKEVWCHPRIWTAIAIECNPKIMAWILTNAGDIEGLVNSMFNGTIVDEENKTEDESPNAIKTYIMYSEDRDIYKIGRSRDLDKRLAQIRTIDYSVRLIAFKYNDYENKLHREYHRYRTDGEWFKLPKYVLDSLIRKHKFTRKLD